MRVQGRGRGEGLGLSVRGEQAEKSERKTEKETKDRGGNIYFRQLLPAQDVATFAKTQIEQLIFNVAGMMKNCMYLVGDATTKECVVVDGCWDTAAIERIAQEDGMKIIAAVATHYHFDHVGGTPPAPLHEIGIKIPGLFDLLQPEGRKGFIHESEKPKALQICGITDDGSLLGVSDGHKVKISDDVSLEFIHTPGHSPGSCCLLVSEKGGQDAFLLSGDTIFPGSHGRVDLPESDPEAMYTSPGVRKLLTLRPDLKIFPGHSYGGKVTTVQKERDVGLLSQLEVGDGEGEKQKIRSNI
ncbi:metallo-beta-lactamase [Chloropicon primus]|uniref:Metallo-beta-lactamase n=1 Tax=Chloropicon primus TaxID=1764295 RepID=A0A5B8MJG5_9CHLO|nr:metallo-beta-lactamase [Chloropicon primus]UPQ98702.1 metallo-beta-lactamase [Chloropicon primus]|eukprot:QDZ19492.1 metallo-beta-lactamase [Chloropicon primus]